VGAPRQRRGGGGVSAPACERRGRAARGRLVRRRHATPFSWVAWDEEAEAYSERLEASYFDLHRVETPEGSVEFNLPLGSWIRLFREHGFVVEDLIEVRPPEGAASTYRTDEETAWARRWPMEQIWKVRKAWKA
jgi:hypothetical protein